MNQNPDAAKKSGKNKSQVEEAFNGDDDDVHVYYHMLERVLVVHCTFIIR